MKSFSQITKTDLSKEFGVTIIGGNFIPDVLPIEVPSWLNHVIENRKNNFAALRTEKAVSEALIAPILMSVQESYLDKITVFSGEPLATDELSGVCDFLITKEAIALDPQGGGYFVLVEAKKNDLLLGIPQCVAEMYAAQVLNGNNDIVYGCVSTGLEWLFIKLEGKIATTDPKIFTISEVDKILGVFGWIINR